MKLNAILEQLGRAELYQDRELRAKAMESLLRLAMVGEEYLSNQKKKDEPQKEPTPTKASQLRLSPKWSSQINQTIDGERATLYRSNGYRSIVRALARDNRLTYRPGHLRGSYWLKASELALVRRVHRAMYESKEAPNG